MKMTRRKKFILALFFILLLLQTITYLLFGSFDIVGTALQRTPEHIHFAEGATFSWVCLELDKCENLTDQQKEELLEAFQRNYKTVYKSESEIPKSFITKRENSGLMSYHDGFLFQFSIVSQGPFWIKIHHHDFEHYLAGSWGDVLYVWFLGLWIPMPYSLYIA